MRLQQQRYKKINEVMDLVHSMIRSMRYSSPIIFKGILTCIIIHSCLVQSCIANELDYSTLKYLAVQKDGRKKPFDTVAAETLQKLTGTRVYKDPVSGQEMQAIDVYCSMWLETKDWSAMPIILVSYQPLKELLNLDDDRRLFSYNELAKSQLQTIIDGAAAKDQNKLSLTREEREAQVLSQRLRSLREAIGLEALAVVPHPTDQKGKWVSLTQVSEYYTKEQDNEGTQLLLELGTAYSEQDSPTFVKASSQLLNFLQSLSPTVYPEPGQLRREVHYNGFHAFRKAMYFYGFAFVWLLATWGVKKPVTYWIAVAVFMGGILLHGWGFYLRIMISGRPPVTNMYESVIWVSFGAALFALLLEFMHRQKYYLAAVAPLSAVLLIMADQLPAVLDPSIGPLVPVLRDNFWLSVHVPTITLGYAALLVAMGVGHISLGYYLFRPDSKKVMERLEHLIYRAMQIGVLLLATGTILGGIWAHYAWGRFWGWDPKETWALIALLCYLIPLHGRMTGWMTNFAISVASVLCFMAILMAWYGVNFVLGQGLHSYGFGVGGFSYVLGFIAIEVLYVAVAAMRRRLNQRSLVSHRQQTVPQETLTVK